MQNTCLEVGIIAPPTQTYLNFSLWLSTVWPKASEYVVAQLVVIILVLLNEGGGEIKQSTKGGGV